MRRVFLAFLAAVLMFGMTGCGNLSPRADPKLDQKIDNQSGKIGEISNMQNSMRAEVGNLKSQADIQNSKLDRIQQGLLNLQQNNDNHGLMLFSGTGGLVLAVVGLFSVVCLTVVCVHYRSQAQLHEKTANILAERIVAHDDPRLENAVFEAVLHTNVAENVLTLIKKHKTLTSLEKPKDLH